MGDVSMKKMGDVSVKKTVGSVSKVNNVSKASSAGPKYFSCFKEIFRDPLSLLKSLDTKKILSYAGFNLLVIGLFILLTNILTFFVGKITDEYYGGSFVDALAFGMTLKLLFGIALSLLIISGLFFLLGKLFNSDKEYKDYLDLFCITTFLFAFLEFGRFLILIFSSVFGFALGKLGEVALDASYDSILRDVFSFSTGLVDVILSLGNFVIIPVLVFSWIIIVFALSEYYDKSHFKTFIWVISFFVGIRLIFFLLGFFEILESSLFNQGFDYVLNSIGWRY